ncbi:MAG: T9SS type A sorting domain-containing protein [Bacteroidia bacterium]|nr:T9SS type A sorting domain-containing protein [Bacteroidia bacterium]
MISQIKKNHLFAALIALGLGFSSSGHAQNATFPGEGEAVEGTIQLFEKVSTFEALRETDEPEWRASLKNTRVAPEPGVPSPKAEFKAHKEKINAERRAADAIVNASTPAQSNKTQTQGLRQEANWFGPSTDGTPNDNDLAISAGGKVVAVVNTNVAMWRASGGSPVFNKSLAVWVGLPGNAFVFDPRVEYDPELDRFIIVFLEGSDVNQSFIHVCFSATTDPFGAWNHYKLSGTVNNNWTDYPNLGINKSECFITTNMSPQGSNFVNHGVIWQINKFDGYSGNATITTKNYFLSNEVGWQPVLGGNSLYGPQAYFIRSQTSPFGNTKVYYLREITDKIANGGTISSTQTFQSNITYTTPPDADQMGSNVDLNTNGANIQSAYLENGKIQFAHTTKFNSKPQLLYGTVQMSGLGLSFAQFSAQMVAIDSFHCGFPALAYAGVDAFGNNKSIMAFEFAGPNYYPGTAAIYIDENGNTSAPLILKKGFQPIDLTSTGNPPPQRWGDYSGIDDRRDNLGEAWYGGCIGIGGNNNATWISQILTDSTQIVAKDPEITKVEGNMTVFPNPTVEFVNVFFDVPENKNYVVSLMDMSGKTVTSFPEKRLSRGTGRFTFNVAHLQSGVYFLNVTSNGEKVYSEKVVVNH